MSLLFLATCPTIALNFKQMAETSESFRLSRKRGLANRLPSLTASAGDEQCSKNQKVEQDESQAKKSCRSRPTFGITYCPMDSAKTGGTCKVDTEKHPAHTHSLINNQIIGNYRIVGAGHEARAVHIPTNQVFKAKVLSRAGSRNIREIFDRLNDADKYYHANDISDMRDRVIPRSTECVPIGQGMHVLFTPADPQSQTVHDYATDRGEEITEAEIHHIFFEVVALLDFCHSIGILVRDLKPRRLVFFGNRKRRIRLDSAFECRVLASPYNDEINDRFCSPAYVPPEVIKMERPTYSGKAADMWGMGVTLFMLLFGQYPFFDRTPTLVFQKILRAKVIMPPAHLSPQAKTLVQNMLRRDPSERPTAQSLLQQPFWDSPWDLPCRVTKLDYTDPTAVSNALPLLRQRFDRVQRQILENSIDETPMVPDRPAGSTETEEERRAVRMRQRFIDRLAAQTIYPELRNREGQRPPTGPIALDRANDQSNSSTFNFFLLSRVIL